MDPLQTDLIYLGIFLVAIVLLILILARIIEDRNRRRQELARGQLKELDVSLKLLEIEISRHRSYQNYFRKKDRISGKNRLQNIQTGIKRILRQSLPESETEFANSLQARTRKVESFIDSYVAEFVKAKFKEHKQFFDEMATTARSGTDCCRCEG